MSTPSTAPEAPRCADCGTTEDVRRYEDLRDHQLVWLCPDSVDFSYHLSVPLDPDETSGYRIPPPPDPIERARWEKGVADRLARGERFVGDGDYLPASPPAEQTQPTVVTEPGLTPHQRQRDAALALANLLNSESLPIVSWNLGSVAPGLIDGQIPQRLGTLAERFAGMAAWAAVLHAEIVVENKNTDAETLRVTASYLGAEVEVWTINHEDGTCADCGKTGKVRSCGHCLDCDLGQEPADGSGLAALLDYASETDGDL